MMKAADELKKNSKKYAEVVTKEIGKPLSQAIAEVEKCAWVCEYYAENAGQHLKNEVIETDAHKSYTSYEPLGVVPLNYPFGGYSVLKHLI